MERNSQSTYAQAYACGHRCVYMYTYNMAWCRAGALAALPTHVQVHQKLKLCSMRKWHLYNTCMHAHLYYKSGMQSTLT